MTRAGSKPRRNWSRRRGRQGSDLKLGVDFSVPVNRDVAQSSTADLRQIVDDLGLKDKVQIHESC